MYDYIGYVESRKLLMSMSSPSIITLLVLVLSESLLSAAEPA